MGLLWVYCLSFLKCVGPVTSKVERQFWPNLPEKQCWRGDGPLSSAIYGVWKADPDQLSPVDEKLSSGAQLLTSSSLLLWHSPTVPVWVELCLFCCGADLNSWWEENKVLSASGSLFQGAGMVHPRDPDCTGNCMSCCGVVFRFVFLVRFLFFKFCLGIKISGSWDSWRQDSLQFS